MKWNKRKTVGMIAGVLCLAMFGSACAMPPLRTAEDMTAEAGYMPEYQAESYLYEEPDWNTEEYGSEEENRFRETAISPLSTFAADVDTASYANIRRKLLAGELPEPDAVRIEEMLNYFSYGYPQPAEEEPFSVTTELADCPWNNGNKLLLIGLQTRKPDTQALPASNLVFLLDVSGSMDDADKLPLMKRAFLLLTEQLRPEDRVSIVTYASGDEVVLRGAGGGDKTEIMSAIENLTAGGGTAGSKGIKTAYALAEQYFIPGGNNRIILGTDGDLNIGVTSEGELKRLVEAERESGVSLSVMGFGTGNLKDNKMETLADHGNGNYSYIDDVSEARKVLVKEMGGTLFTVAKDVKLQVEFNPAKVSDYRLIGYENRKLEDEDFDDDTKDGGEIGAGHSMTAIYEITEASSAPAGESGLKYQKNVSTGSDEYLTVKIRYKEPDGEESRLMEYPVDATRYSAVMSDNMKFASAVAEAGMLMKKSQYVGSGSYEDALARLAEIPGLSQDEYKYEFYYMVQAASSLSGGTEENERISRWEDLLKEDG